MSRHDYMVPLLANTILFAVYGAAVNVLVVCCYFILHGARWIIASAFLAMLVTSCGCSVSGPTWEDLADARAEAKQDTEEELALEWASADNVMKRVGTIEEEADKAQRRGYVDGWNDCASYVAKQSDKVIIIQNGWRELE